MAVMLLVPVAEAFMCGFGGAAVVVMDVSAGDVDQGSEAMQHRLVGGISGDGDHGRGAPAADGCAHGHCHVPLAHVFGGACTLAHERVRQILPVVLASVTSFISEGLLRPPRA